MKANQESLQGVSVGSTAEPESRGWNSTFSPANGPAATMEGRPASPGFAMGRARVVKGRDDIIRVREGEVVIAGTASPDLAMVMSRARAIATERGGQGAIASVLAREHLIPAAVGVDGLMEAVRDGDLVWVDGTRGIVKIVGRAEEG